ncbi:MAG: hypothetical protein WDN69_12785 [Aliidongia sp.]
MRAAADEDTEEIRPSQIVAQRLDRADQVVDAVLLADFAQIDQQMRLAAPIGGIRRMRMKRFRSGPERTT